MTNEQFAIRLTENGHGPVLLIAGDLDLATVPMLQACLRDFTGQHVTLDFTDVTFMDSSALGVVVAADKKAFQTGGRIVFRGVRPAQMKVFEITNLTEYLHFDDDDHGDVPQELLDAARQELEYPADETNEG